MVTESRIVKAWRHLREKWVTARYDSSEGEVTYRQWGDVYGYHLTHGWWVDPRDWSFGISLANDFQEPGPLYPGRFTFGIEVGPFDWHLSLNQPERKYKRLLMGYEPPKAYPVLDRLARLLIVKPEPEEPVVIVDEVAKFSEQFGVVDEAQRKRGAE